MNSDILPLSYCLPCICIYIDTMHIYYIDTMHIYYIDTMHIYYAHHIRTHNLYYYLPFRFQFCLLSSNNANTCMPLSRNNDFRVSLTRLGKQETYLKYSMLPTQPYWPVSSPFAIENKKNISNTVCSQTNHTDPNPAPLPLKTRKISQIQYAPKPTILTLIQSLCHRKQEKYIKYSMLPNQPYWP